MSRIDLKTASHDEVVLFVKRQNKHIRELEALLDKLETRHKEYKAQLREYSQKLEESNSLSHLSGDERLKHQIQALQIERDALAAELQEKQAHGAPSEPTSPVASTSALTAPNVSKAELDRLHEALEAAKAKLDASSSSSVALEQRLQRTINTQQSEISKQVELVSQLTTACDALKARLSHVSAQHATKLQSLTSEQESKLQTLNSTIVQLQRELSKEKEVPTSTAADDQVEAPNSNSAPIAVSSPSEAPEVAPSPDVASQQPSEDAVKEIESLRRQIEELKKANDALQTSPLTSTAPPTAMPTPVAPVEDKKDDRAEQIQKLEEKLTSKQALLVKAHKHLGELTAQLADTNLRAQQLASEKLRLETASASVAELRLRNSELEASLEEARGEFERYRIKVAVAENEKLEAGRISSDGSPAPSPAPTGSEVPTGLQDKIDELTSEIEKLRFANEQLRSESEVTNGELTSLRAKHQTAVSHLRHYKDKETSREASSDKRLKEREVLEEKHKTQLAEISTKFEEQAAASTAQYSRLRVKADDVIKQRDAEISSLKDMIEVLKIQVSQSEPKRVTGPVSRATDFSTEATRRRTSTDSTGSPTRRRGRQGEDAFGAETSSRTGSLTFDTPSVPHSAETTPRDDQNPPIQVVINRMNALQDQVSELEQLLALSREQEQFLKLELRKYDHSAPSAASSAGSSSSSRPATPSNPIRNFEMISASDYSVLRNLLKNMLESGETPNMMVFADLLRFSQEEVVQIQTRANANTGAARVASAVENGMSALWNAFGSPQRR